MIVCKFFFNILIVIKNKIRITESDFVKIIKKIISEESNDDIKNLDMEMGMMSKEQISKKTKMSYFINIYLRKFNEIKEFHGLEFTTDLLLRLSEMINKENKN